MPIFRSMVAAAVLLVGMMGPGNTKQPPENWISTWAAPPVARVDQPAQSLSAAGQGCPSSNDLRP
ncbi:MAG: hypothetical protein ACK55I_46730, partial [bacterium]